MSFLMSDILTTIRDLASMELEDLDSDVTNQNAAIFRFTTVALRKRARQAYIVEVSTPLNITTDGYQDFGAADMYEPLAIYGPTDKVTQKRTSWDAPTGWWRQSDFQNIHTRGMLGDHTLHYLRYPVAVTSSTTTVEFPLAGQMDLIMDVVSLIKLPKNFYQESDAIKAKATGTATIKATINARGNNGNYSPPSLTDKEE